VRKVGRDRVGGAGPHGERRGGDKKREEGEEGESEHGELGSVSGRLGERREDEREEMVGNETHDDGSYSSSALSSASTPMHPRSCCETSPFQLL